MAEDRFESPPYDNRQGWSWMALFRGFSIALDLNKLLLAAAGILVMAFGWWLLANIFNTERPDYTKYQDAETQEEKKALWAEFKEDRRRWVIRYSAAGSVDDTRYAIDEGDLAETPEEYSALKSLRSTTNQKAVDEKALKEAEKKLYPDPKQKPTVDQNDEDRATYREQERQVNERRNQFRKKLQVIEERHPYPAGALRTMPWYEDRGPNPWLMLTGQTERPWKAGEFVEWLFTEQMPVLLEPLVKLLSPIVYFFKNDVGFVNNLYFFLVMLWGVITWAIFGGAITRIAAMQIARQEKITLSESLRFVFKRIFSYITAPLFPIVVIAFLTLFTALFGLLQMVPGLGELLNALLWWLMLIFGIIMAVGLIGLIGWPLMSATISADGTDNWEAVSRSYSYVFQAPWHYVWYSLVALLYGAVIVFVVGLVGSIGVYVSKWGVSKGVFVRDRDPSFLYVYSPTSYGWRTLMLSDVQLRDGTYVVDPTTGEINKQNYEKYLGNDKSYEGSDRLEWWNKLGAGAVTFWIFLFFLIVLGFGYSYFWSAATMIYFLLRQKVDTTEMDEVYLEEEDLQTYPSTVPPPPPSESAPPPAGGQTLPIVDNPPASPGAGSPPVQAPAPAPEPSPSPEPPPSEPPPESASPAPAEPAPAPEPAPEPEPEPEPETSEQPAPEPDSTPVPEPSQEPETSEAPAAEPEPEAEEKPASEEPATGEEPAPSGGEESTEEPQSEGQQEESQDAGTESTDDQERRDDDPPAPGAWSRY